MKKSLFVPAGLAVCLAGWNLAHAQQVIVESTDVVQEGDGEAPKGAIVMSATSEDGGPPVIQSFGVFNSDDGQTFEMAMPAFTPMVNTDQLSSLLALPDVREELEMVDDQFAELQEAQKEISRELSKQMNEIMKGGKFDPSKAGGLKELLAEQQKLAEGRIQEMLTPQQLERLRQIALRVRMKQSGAIGMLGSKEVQEALEIDEEQLKKLKEKAKEIQEAMEEKIADLKKEAREELLDELTSKQRKKLDEMLGSEFDYKPVDFRDRIRSRGGEPPVRISRPKRER